jgi:Tfp pilus assembly protein PilZ
METTQKTGILLIFNIVLLAALLITLLYLIQKGAEEKTGSIEELAQKALLEKNTKELYSEAAEKPYFETHPEELAITEIKIDDFRFVSVENGNVIENTKKEYNLGENITLSLSVYDYMNPKSADYQYVYGIKIWAETTDSNGNIIASLSGIAVDTANYNPVKGMKIPYNIMLIPDNTVKPGKYKVKITAFDVISKIENIHEEEFTII